MRRVGGLASRARGLCALSQVKHGSAAAPKASPTVQRLIREAGLVAEDIEEASGPKGTILAGDVEKAAAKAAAALEAASVPFDIELAPPLPAPIRRRSSAWSSLAAARLAGLPLRPCPSIWGHCSTSY